ncbi:MAG TPA: hypothetical protein PKA32_01390, partial [Candidatus Gracilibacteria bacterium]|nr:hypothetical protein [Candidatus Gracilibacteria bacterium]
QKGIQLETVLQHHKVEIDQALALNEDLFRSEQLAHEYNGFDLYWKHVLTELGPHTAERLNESADFFEYMRSRARENFETIKEKHKEFCEKTYNEAKEQVEREMILDEEELRNEELFHGGEDKLRIYLKRKIRDLKKRLAPEMYEKLEAEVISPLLEKRTAEYQEKHKEFCEKTYNEAKEQVESEMVLDSSEMDNDALFEQGEQALRAYLKRKIRDLKKRLAPGMYEKLEQEVIDPLLEERVAEYMEIFNTRKIKLEKEDEAEQNEEAAEETDNAENQETSEVIETGENPSDAESGSEVVQEGNTEVATEGSGESVGETITTEAAQTQESAGVNAESAQASETSQTIQANQTSESSQSNQTVTKGINQTSQTVESSVSSEVDSKAQKEAAKTVKPKEQNEKIPAEKSKFTQLAGVKQLLSKGEHHFLPFLTEWENSMDSAQHRKATHEIMTRAKTARTLVAWLLEGSHAQRTAIIQKKFPGAWKKFYHGMQLFGFVPPPDAEGLQPLPEEKLDKSGAIKIEELETEKEEGKSAETLSESAKEENSEEFEEKAEEGFHLEEDQTLLQTTEVQEEPEQEESEIYQLFEEAPAFEEPFVNVLESYSNLEDSLKEESDEPKQFEESIQIKIEDTDQFLDEPFETPLDEPGETEPTAELTEEEIQEIETTIEDLEQSLEEDESLQEEVDNIEDSLMEDLDEVLMEFDELDEFNEDDFGIEGLESELENLHELFALLVEDTTFLDDIEDAEDEEEGSFENAEQRGALTPKNLRRFLLLLQNIAQDGQEQTENAPKMSMEALLESLAKQLTGINIHEVERKILAILRYYPQFRFLLLLLLRKLYLESGSQEYIQLMMLIFQEQYGTKGISLQEITTMLIRFLRFLGTNPETHYCIHEALHDYTVLNPNELLKHLSHHICNFPQAIERIPFISRPHHCRFDPLS